MFEIVSWAMAVSVHLDTEAARTCILMNKLSLLHAGYSARPAKGCAPPQQ